VPDGRLAQLPCVRGATPTRSWKPTREVHEARSANSSPVSNFTEFAVLLTVADTCRGDSLAAVAQAHDRRLSGQAHLDVASGQHAWTESPSGFCKYARLRWGRTSFGSCGSAQRGIRIGLHVNDLAESDTIEIGSAISVSAH
jgi:hypothetical protein